MFSIIADSKLIGLEKIFGKKKFPNLKFDVRFHLEPSAKIMKTQDNKSILVELDKEGWKFTCKNFEIDIDNGLYFGKKNNYSENQNIYIYGKTSENDESINWIFQKI